MPLYRILGTLSFKRAEPNGTVEYREQSADWEVEAATPQSALSEAQRSFEEQAVSDVQWHEGPTVYEWFCTPLGQGWKEAQSG